jgi:hypothetical protein
MRIKNEKLKMYNEQRLISFPLVGRFITGKRLPLVGRFIAGERLPLPVPENLNSHLTQKSEQSWTVWAFEKSDFWQKSDFLTQIRLLPKSVVLTDGMRTSALLAFYKSDFWQK